MVPVPGGDFEVVEDDFEVVEDDFEVVDETPKPVKKLAAARKSARRDDDEDDRPRKKRKVVADYDDDEEDDDEDDRPRKKGKKKAASSSKLPLLIGGGVLLLLLLAVGGYFLFSGKKNWTKFDAPDGSFTAYFPTGVPVNKGVDALMEGEDPKQAEQAKAMMAMFQFKIDAWVRDEPNRQYIVMLMEFPAAMASMIKPDDLMKPIPKGGKGGGMPGMPGMDGEVLNDETTSISGQTAKQILVKDKSGKTMFIRMFFASGRLVMVGVRTSGELKVDDKDALEYFKKFEWKAPATPAPDPKASPDPKTTPADKKPNPRRGR
jgi:hypothetical protein